MDIFSIVGLAITATAICIILKQYKPEYAMLASIVCSLLIFSAIIVNIVPVFDELKTFLNKISYESEYLAVVVKALGICFVTQLASDACKDAGQEAISSKVELAGKVAVIIISMPLFSKLINIVMNLINM